MKDAFGREIKCPLPPVITDWSITQKGDKGMKTETFIDAFGNKIDYPVIERPGMTLRDYFAGQALTGLCANHALIDSIGKTGAEWLVMQSDIIADAMILARETK